MDIFALPAVSNRSGFQHEFELEDAETGTPIALDAGTDEVVFTARDERGCVVLNGTLSSGEVAIIATGVIQITFTRAQMSALRAAQYSIGLTFDRSGDTEQIMVGTIQVVDGVVPV